MRGNDAFGRDGHKVVAGVLQRLTLIIWHLSKGHDPSLYNASGSRPEDLAVF